MRAGRVRRCIGTVRALNGAFAMMARLRGEKELRAVSQVRAVSELRVVTVPGGVSVFGQF